MSILRSFADRADMRPCSLTHPRGWHGETGQIDEALLRRHLGRGSQRWQYLSLVCGAAPHDGRGERCTPGDRLPGSQIHSGTVRLDIGQSECATNKSAGSSSS